MYTLHTHTQPLISRIKHGSKLTLVTGGALPSLFADAGEGVSSAHAGPSVGARIGGTGAVLGFGGQNTVDVRLAHGKNKHLIGKRTSVNVIDITLHLMPFITWLDQVLMTKWSKIRKRTFTLLCFDCNVAISVTQP